MFTFVILCQKRLRTGNEENLKKTVGALRDFSKGIKCITLRHLWYSYFSFDSVLVWYQGTLNVA